MLRNQSCCCYSSHWFALCFGENLFLMFVALFGIRNAALAWPSCLPPLQTHPFRIRRRRCSFHCTRPGRNLVIKSLLQLRPALGQKAAHSCPPQTSQKQRGKVKVQDPQPQSIAIVLNSSSNFKPLHAYRPQSHMQFSDGLRAPKLSITDVPTAPKPWQSSAGLDPTRKNRHVSTYFALEMGSGFVSLIAFFPLVPAFCYFLHSKNSFRHLTTELIMGRNHTTISCANEGFCSFLELCCECCSICSLSSIKKKIFLDKYQLKHTLA